MKRNSGKTETTDTTLDQEQPDGVVGKKTRDELDRWLQNNWIEPIPTVRKDDYDDTGVQNGKGKRGGDDHHQRRWKMRKKSFNKWACILIFPLMAGAMITCMKL
jgi:hypothetical protein